ncbi:collagen binding domain-containing protein [Lysinibacillus capsici]|uniref:collagen binding domain-containing protein n=1 Tax=Lysinibacillus capsici TaxID=2115968 RepID=UPI0028975ADE|nr:collagen binding domain-containing protein [Lysinibacillus capsici]
MKKLNIAIIILLLVFQTVLSPISVFADESQPPVTPSNESSQDVGTNLGDEGELPVTPPATSEEDAGTSFGGEPSVTSPTNPEEETGNDNGDGGEDTGISIGDKDNGMVPENQTKPLIEPLEASALPPTDLTSSVKLDVFELKINGTDVVPPAFTTELAQNQQANGKFIFKVDLPGDVKAGDFFTYSLPASLIDFNSAFNGQKPATPISPAFDWHTSGNKVTVTITEDPSEDIAGSNNVGFEMNFTSGFNLLGNNVEQDLEIPLAGGGTDVVKLTFLPSTSNEKMVTKKSLEVTVINGERTIDWEVWVNKAGKNLTNATIMDTPGPGHILVPNSVTIETYEVGLNGVATTAAGTQLNQNFEDIVLDGRNAYKIKYQTKVNLPISQQEGTKEFSNSIKLTDPTYEDSDTEKASTTYGKTLEKSLDGTKTSNNYISSWEVRYNYNQAAIDQADAWVEDTLPTGHVIDTNTIKVYAMTVNDTGTATGAGTEIDATEYQVNPIINNGHTDGFKLEFNNSITKAYRITYDAKLPTDFYSNNTTTKMTNSVISGSGAQAKTATHTLTEGILTKSRTVDTNKKEITWTITVKADNNTADGKDITGLTIADTFTEGSHNAPHTLVDANNDSVINDSDITVSNMTGQTISIDANGFTLTGGTVSKGQTATITYKTAYEILPDGSVHEQGYGNKAIASWTTDKLYSVEKLAHYKPESNSVNNGRKQGKYDYVDQVFNWDIKVNINKQNINNAVLQDIIGEGHVIVPGTFKVKEFTLNTTDNDENGTEGADLPDSLYSLDIPSDNKSFTLTLANNLGVANNKVYIVKYQTRDSDNIIGIESSNKADKNKLYTNTATFTTNVGGSPKVYNLPATPVPVNYANKLIEKGNPSFNSNQTTTAPSSNSTTERLTWMLNVNRSLSTLGEVKVEDVPSGNQMLLKETIQVRKNAVNKDTGISSGGSWSTPASLGFTVTFTASGGFEIDFGVLNKESYQIQYQTLVLGKKDDAFSNDAKINFGFATADNQEQEAKYSGSFSFSASDADFSLTKGNLKFNKVGLNTLTGLKKPLSDIEFELVKMVKGSPYVVATAISDQDGNVVFENVNYANYILKEKEAKLGYDLMSDFPIKLNEDTDTALAKNATKVIELVNNEQFDATNACPAFTLTVKDIDGNAIANKNIKLIDSNGNAKYTGTTNAAGQVSDIKRPGTGGKEVQAGVYTLVDENDIPLGTVTVKYGTGECQDTVQPTNSCPNFKITVKNENGNPRPNVSVTLKDLSNTVIATGTTNSDGQFIIDKTTPAGKYKLYEGTQYLGEVNVTYHNDNCQSEVQLAPKCETFELTVYDVDGNLVADGTSVTVKNKDTGNIIATKTTKDGVIELSDLEPGVYTVVVDGEEIDEFESNIDCKASVQPTPKCENFTVIIKDNTGIIKPGNDVIIKDKSGKVISTNKDKDGNLTFVSKTTPAGKYDVYDKNIYLGEIEVSYASVPCEITLSIAPVCPAFTLTINNMFGQPRVGVKVTITGEDGIQVEDNGSTEFITDSKGQITINNSIIKPGKYIVRENGKTIIGTVIVGNTCEAKIQPSLPVTPPTTNPGNPDPDPEKPVDPNKPNPDPEKPVDPNKPNPDPEKPVDPNKPNPDPEKPVDPNKPNPDPEKPVDPNKPNPDPENPVEPNKPNPDSNNSANPGKTEGSKPSVQGVIDQGKNLPPYNPTKATKDTLDAYKDFLNKYSQLTKEEQEAVAESLDINKIKSDAKRLEAQLKAQGKLPQTDGADQTALMLIGVALILGALYFLRRRNAEVK